MTSIVVGKDRISLVESERYVAGTQNVYVMKVSFSEDWEGLEKKLVFRTDEFEMAVEIITCSEQFPIPSEIFYKPSNKLQVGCYASKCGETTLNTRWLSLGRIVKGTLNTDCSCGCQPPSKPSPDTYKVLRELIDRKADRLTYEDGQFILWAGDDPLSSFDAPIALPSGGSAGQFLAKASDKDGDYEWKDADGLSLRLPVGSIQIWSGAIDKIPEGFSLCDGQNGTPDLRGAMIVGASESIEPGTVVKPSLEDQVMPLNLEPDKPVTPVNPSKPGTNTDIIEFDPQSTIRYYALAFIQKTSLTELDKKQGLSAYDIAVDNGFEGTEEEWLESLHGKSAYDIAVENGFEGTEDEWLEQIEAAGTPVAKSLVISSKADIPEPGFGAFVFDNVTVIPKSMVPAARTASLLFTHNYAYINVDDPAKFVITTLDNKVYECELDEDGAIISIREVVMSGGGGEVIEGAKGDPGDSAYQIAVKKGFEGTEEEWLESLKGLDGEQGPQGLSAYEIAQNDGFTGTEAEWLASLKGKSAYEIAVENGFTGTEQEWVESIQKDTAENVSYDNTSSGLTATTIQEAIDELAKSGGSSGTGKDGKSAYEIAVENGFEGTEVEWLASLKGADGKSAYEIAVENGYTGTEEEWTAAIQNGSAEDVKYDDTTTKLGATNVQGAIEKLHAAIETVGSGTGAPGPSGADGKSAYQIAVDNGFEGSEEDWLVSLVGPAGADGVDGVDGKNGKSAYELAVAGGFDGSEAEWLNSLKGAKGDPGDSAYKIAQNDGFAGTETEWLASLKGAKGDTGSNGEDGKSAYQIAQDAGYTGTEAEWLESLKGATGAKGKSAYQLAVDAGFDGDEAAWLASLKGDPGPAGADGKSTYEIAVENGFEGDEASWLETAKGPKGDDGKSAYDIAVENGYEGTVNQWLDSLKGEGIAEFITYADQTITSRDVLVAIDVAKVAHFERCKLAAADGNSVTLNDELLFIEPADLSLKAYRANGEILEIAFGEDEIFTTLTISKIEGIPGQNGSDGKSAYEIAVEEGFEGTKSEWLLSLRGEQGLPGETVQRLEDYSETSTIIGRWTDGKPVKRQVITRNVTVPAFTDFSYYDLGHLDPMLTITRMTTIATFTNGDDILSDGEFKTQLPAIYNDIWVNTRYYPQKETGTNTYLILKGTSAEAIDISLTTILEYVDSNDGELTDDDMIVGGGSGTGVSDHRLLTNRDSADQHPISAISTLTDRLAVTPTTTVTNEQIDALFT